MHKFAQVCEAAWRNGIASDYESGDCRFDPCGGHLVAFFSQNIEELNPPSPMRLTQVTRFSEKLLSTVHRGIAFEKRALSLLTEHMSMSLTRVGGSHDGGVDLIGWWWVPGGEKPTITCACPCTMCSSAKSSADA